ncbi:DUF262 domain-containing protein (plasmid) [Paraburkholderia sp. FT54]|uniref:GmrSD restriction endonuclease domain-containing protein n=1 Tax=Paraburkholderia sp. FT54 TaxID=3074437 RepID=UPI0028773BDA|nr:DUF262 domain-containing protein [Paraburkholderia sp. FT54]WNC95229.1 DUF262 domain-containing protein [Paraburkholderia sp. FT54]
MEYQHYSIRKILDAVVSGEIRIPAFQRGFVWEMDRVAYLLDSIYKGYPFGSLLFWRTKHQLTTERNLGTFTLPEPHVDYPIDYVIDGQQRLTSVFTVFQTELKAEPNPDWADVYFDLEAGANPQDSAFIAISPADGYDKNRYFPMNVLFDSVKYRLNTEHLDAKKIELVDRLQERFKEAQLPVQVLKSEDRSSVAIVFERINHLGVALDTLQLLSAWTWSDDFDLLDKFRELKEELSDFGFAGVGDDADLVLSCVAGILTHEPGPERLLELNGAAVRDQFSVVENGIRGAIDFLRTQLKVVHLKLLPYPSMLIPLAVFFAEADGKEIVFGGDSFQTIKRWFWRTCFSARYTSQTRKTTITDIEQMVKLKAGEATTLDHIDVTVTPDFFHSTFRVGAAATKTFVLLLANNDPRSLLSGKNIDLDKVLQRYNRSEFHHIYPRAFLREQGFADGEINVLGNFCFLSAAENKNIGRKRPSVYVNDLAGDAALSEQTLATAFCDAKQFDDNYKPFLAARCARLVDFANQLTT